MLKGRLYLSIFLRTFLLQGSWNFRGMQHLGFLYAILPALNHFYRDEEFTAAVNRHAGHFNTNPYMAPAVIGTTLALEEQRANGEGEEIDIADFKQMILAPYAAMGDALFWGGIRPLAAVIALFVASKEEGMAPLAFLLLFNIFHLAFRWAGLHRGYHQGIALIDLIHDLKLPDWAIRAKEATIVLLGGYFAYIVATTLESEQIPLFWGLLLLPVMALLAMFYRRGGSVFHATYAIAAGVLLLF